ncbi:hypothetical protein CDD82_602 [Ophiocordyceps australis]|uniref:GH16 domain-containing protein n=1 Tax=Ophiocordyceps australis TaxID=1399860 RepID=A0A2C5YFS5_9HYPO|nr:hypothetical protein CDD82_602 [Ophiocordyceps australis]
MLTSQIDFEWLGADEGRVQTNYFGKGNTTTWDRGQMHNVANPVSAWHTYVIEWTKAKTEWFVDGRRVRELRYEEAQGGEQYPQTPMQVRMGTWAPVEAGSQAWARGPVDFSKGPFVAYVRRVTMVDYGGGEGAVEGVKEYVFKDRSGGWEGVGVVLEEMEMEMDSRVANGQESMADRTVDLQGDMRSSVAADEQESMAVEPTMGLERERSKATRAVWHEFSCGRDVCADRVDKDSIDAHKGIDLYAGTKISGHTGDGMLGRSGWCWDGGDSGLHVLTKAVMDWFKTLVASSMGEHFL